MKSRDKRRRVKERKAAFTTEAQRRGEKPENGECLLQKIMNRDMAPYQAMDNLTKEAR